MYNKCNCKYFHKSVSINKNMVISVECSDNICDCEPFNIILCQCPPASATPLPVQVTVNGSNVPLLNEYGNQVYSNDLKPRKVYYGVYGNSPAHVLLKDARYYGRY